MYRARYPDVGRRVISDGAIPLAAVKESVVLGSLLGSISRHQCPNEGFQERDADTLKRPPGHSYF